MMQPPAEKFVRFAMQHGIRVTTAESCTGGMVSAAITDFAGSSAIFERGFVVYSNDAKVDMLGVSAATLQAHGAVSEQVAEQMAQFARQKAGADLAIAISGIAGPGGSDHKPEGRVCFAVSSSHRTVAKTYEFGAIGRANVRTGARDYAFDMLHQEAASQTD